MDEIECCQRPEGVVWPQGDWNRRAGPKIRIELLKKTRFITGAKERTENYNIIFDSAGTRRVNEPHFGLLKLAATWQRVGRADTILAPCSLLAAPAMQWHFFCFSYSTIPAISMTQGLRGIQRYLQSQTKRKVTIS